MTTHEVRCKGRLIEHFLEEDAHAYVNRRLADKLEGPAFGEGDWTIEPRRPVELHTRGNLHDTYDSVYEAETARADLIADAQQRMQRRGQARAAADIGSFFVITDTREAASEPPPATRPEHPAAV